MNKVNGLLYGLLSSASFGLIPLFTIPAMQAGMQFESILFYRFLFACLALGGILLVNGQSFRIKRQDIPSLFLLALLYLMSAVFLFWGYKFMASGVATTIHFMYPVLTTLIMMLFFKEKMLSYLCLGNLRKCRQKDRQIKRLLYNKMGIHRKMKPVGTHF